MVEPIYGKTYLPRKFKIVVAVPPSNDVDVFAHDLGFIAILDDKGEVAGWNVTVGGGMGMTHGEPDTYPRTADVMGFCETARRGGGRRSRRHRAARLGRPSQPQARAAEIHHRGSRARRFPRRSREARRRDCSQPAKPFTFTSTGDRYGWSAGADGRSHLTLFVQNGRLFDRPAPSSCRRCARSRRATTAISASRPTRT